MLSGVFQRRKDPNMDRGTYSELNQNDVPVELEAEDVPLTGSSADTAYPGEGGRRTDYVLVYETCKEKEEEDEETKKEAATLATSRKFYEKRLQKKGLVLRHESIIAEQVLQSVVLIHRLMFYHQTVVYQTEGLINIGE